MTTSEHLDRIKAQCEYLLETESYSILARHQPCGCLVCNCADEEQCHGCGARNCGTHPVGSIPNPVYLKRRPSHAEAGWRGTIAAIDGLSDVNTCDQWCRGNMPEAADAILEDIIAAWPKELLQPLTQTIP